MNRCTKWAPVTFLLTGWVLWPLMIVTGEQVFPKMPAEAWLNWGGDSEGHWTHAGNNWWSEMTRANAQYISKLLQFLLWWLLFFFIVTPVIAAEKHDINNPSHWWSYACCNEKDCGPAKEGTVKVTNEGYEVTLPNGKVTKLEWGNSRIKEKPADNPYAYDGRHHVCMFYSAYGNEWYLRCLYPSVAAY